MSYFIEALCIANELNTNDIHIYGAADSKQIYDDSKIICDNFKTYFENSKNTEYSELVSRCKIQDNNNRWAIIKTLFIAKIMLENKFNASN